MAAGEAFPSSAHASRLRRGSISGLRHSFSLAFYPEPGQARPSGSEDNPLDQLDPMRDVRFSSKGSGRSEEDYGEHRYSSKGSRDKKYWWGNKLVILETNIYRSSWNIVLAALLLYTATVMPYTLCFLDFRLRGGGEISEGLAGLRVIIDILFWVDLVINFFFSFNDGAGKEVKRLRLCVKNYVQGYFILNLIACIPDQVFSSLTASSQEDDNSGGISGLARLSRVQRLGRLGRLLRLVRLLKVFAFIKENSVVMWLRSLRGVRMLNLCVVLLWVNHLVACGWYLCAALHNDPEVTWVAQRALPDGQSLIDKGDVDQWLQAMYFVLVVFSTVGFGDIVAYTSGECIYVVFTMLVGAVVHGTVMSEVIAVVTKIDDKAAELKKQKDIIKAFVTHTELHDNMKKALTRWLDPAGRSRTLSDQYDRGQMKKILVSGAMPYSLMERMQYLVFGGELLRNKFVQTCVLRSPAGRLPPRFPIILALNMIRHVYQKGELVYQLHDHPSTSFLVLKGIFACVGLPSPAGGKDTFITNEAKNAAATRGTTKNTKSRDSSVSSSSSQIQRFMSLEGDTDADSDALMSSPSRLIKNISGTIFNAVSGNISSPIQKTGPDNKAYPYKLYAYGSYFGEYEVVAARSSGAYLGRKCSVRCESEEAAVLVIAKQDLKQLMSDFPHFGEAWCNAARHNERLRLLARSQHKVALSVRDFAACRIQQCWNAKRLFGTSQALAPISRITSLDLEESADVVPRGNALAEDSDDDFSNLDHVVLQDEVNSLRLELKEMKATVADLKEMDDMGFEDMSVIRSSIIDLRALLGPSSKFERDGSKLSGASPVWDSAASCVRVSERQPSGLL